MGKMDVHPVEGLAPLTAMPPHPGNSEETTYTEGLRACLCIFSQLRILRSGEARHQSQGAGPSAGLEPSRGWKAGLLTLCPWPGTMDEEAKPQGDKRAPSFMEAATIPSLKARVIKQVNKVVALLKIMRRSDCLHCRAALLENGIAQQSFLELSRQAPDTTPISWKGWDLSGHVDSHKEAALCSNFGT